MKLVFLTLRRNVLLAVGASILVYNISASAIKLPVWNYSFFRPLTWQLSQSQVTSSLPIYSEGAISMTATPSRSHLPDEVLGQLQATVLRAILLKEPLPGSQYSIQFPDLQFILRQSPVILVDENLAESFSFTNSSTPIRILPLAAIQQEAQAYGDIAYLGFQAAQVENNVVRLTLEARIAPGNLNEQSLGLSGVQVRFHEVADRWEVTEAPILFAN